ncbi:hypothetical protein PR048_023733 [Dryococelus australis]|uniref:Uncharacterized protein n=1 Tax=Dryococelus australis TaxID=614101 RepID=A0ABQ9GUY9_9NEOP|nr:hypothetical protein PR048_023733 [Dryococelus australis]
MTSQMMVLLGLCIDRHFARQYTDGYFARQYDCGHFDIQHIGSHFDRQCIVAILLDRATRLTEQDVLVQYGRHEFPNPQASNVLALPGIAYKRVHQLTAGPLSSRRRAWTTDGSRSSPGVTAENYYGGETAAYTINSSGTCQQNGETDQEPGRGGQAVSPLTSHQGEPGSISGRVTSAGTKVQGKREIPEKTRLPATSSGTIPPREKSGSNSARNRSGSPSLAIRDRGGVVVYLLASDLCESAFRIRMGISWRTMPLVGGFPRGSPVSPTHAHFVSLSSALKTSMFGHSYPAYTAPRREEFGGGMNAKIIDLLLRPPISQMATAPSVFIVYRGKIPWPHFYLVRARTMFSWSESLLCLCCVHFHIDLLNDAAPRPDV